MIKVAIPQWHGRVSPVFDVAGSLLLVGINHGVEESRQSVDLKDDSPCARANLMAEMGVDVLICGAISWPLAMALSAAGVEVTSRICGDVEEVLAAFIHGRLTQDAFRMPGCGDGRRGVHASRRVRPGRAT